jgi:hypothetical protein
MSTSLEIALDGFMSRSLNEHEKNFYSLVPIEKCVEKKKSIFARMPVSSQGRCGNTALHAQDSEPQTCVFTCTHVHLQLSKCGTSALHGHDSEPTMRTHMRGAK